MDLKRIIDDEGDVCPACGARVVVTDEEGSPPVVRQTGRCAAGHDVERDTGLEQTAWRLQSR